MKEYATIIFTRFPTKGAVKTRLSKNIDKNSVLEIHKAMIKDTIHICKNNMSDIFIFITEFEKLNEKTCDFFCNEKNIFPQENLSFGQKMKFSFQKVFSMGYKKVILIGTDIPTIKSDDIKTALKTLDSVDAYISKTFDNGYYLIGIKKIFDSVFDDNIFESCNVFENTVKAFKKENLTFDNGRVLRDIDTKKDLDFFISNEYDVSEYKNFKKFLKENYIET